MNYEQARKIITDKFDCQKLYENPLLEKELLEKLLEVATPAAALIAKDLLTNRFEAGEGGLCTENLMIDAVYHELFTKAQIIAFAKSSLKADEVAKFEAVKDEIDHFVDSLEALPEDEKTAPLKVEYIKKSTLSFPDLWEHFGMERDNAGRWFPSEASKDYLKDYLSGHRSPSRAYPHSYSKALLSQRFSKLVTKKDPLLAVKLGIAAQVEAVQVVVALNKKWQATVNRFIKWDKKYNDLVNLDDDKNDRKQENAFNKAAENFNELPKREVRNISKHICIFGY